MEGMGGGSGRREWVEGVGGGSVWREWVEGVGGGNGAESGCRELTSSAIPVAVCFVGCRHA